MKLSVLTSGLGIIALLAGCQNAPPALNPDFAFVHVNVIDVATGEVKPDQIVMIEADTIVATGDFSTTVIPNDVATVFAKGQFLMPGLMDSHVHAFQSVEASTQKTLPLFVAHGVTRIRDMGSELGQYILVRNTLAESPDLIHPEIVSTGPLIDSKKLSWYGDLQLIIENTSEISDQITRLEANGISQLKMYTNLKPEIYQSLAQQAQTRGIRIVGHIPVDVSLHEAAEARQLTVEHLDVLTLLSCAPDNRDWFEESIKARYSASKEDYFHFIAEYWDSLYWQSCEAALKKYQAAGGYWTPTLVMETADAGLIDESALDYLDIDSRQWCENDLAATRLALPAAQHAAYTGLKHTLDKIRSAGIPLIAGTDSPNNCLVPGASLIWELIRMADFGLSNLEALQSATLHPAIAFTGKARLIRAGDPAELILLTDNPLEGLQALKNPEGVYINGQWLDSTALNDLKEAANQYVEKQSIGKQDTD